MTPVFNRRLRGIMATMLLVCCISCNNTHDEVVATYQNGNPRLVFTLQGKSADSQKRISETAYYEDGTTMYTKHFKDDKPNGTWSFYYPDGTLFAQGDYSVNHETGSNWQFNNDKGENLFDKDYDSVIILQATDDHRPLSIAYCMGNDQMRYRFNDNYTVNARGLVKDGRKEGRWEFFYANGQLQMEALYHNDYEDGAYNSYRENGIPYFRGFYINGRRASVWEFYDEKGNLAGKQDFDKH